MPAAVSGFRVVLPGADDVYDLVPDVALSPAERERRRAERRARIESSPTPAIVRGVQDILQRIDDVQDGLVTLSLVTRLAVPYVPGLAPLGRAVASAADLANLGLWMRRAGLVGGSWKSSLYRHLSTMPGTYSSRFRSTLRTGRVNPTVGELLQVLQTADSLYGVGMQLGSVMGLPIDLVSLALRGGSLDVDVEGLATLASLAPVFLSSSPWLQLAGLAGGFALSALAPAERRTLSIPIPGLLPTRADVAPYVDGVPSMIPTVQALGTAEHILEVTPDLDVLGQELHPRDHAMIEIARMEALALLVVPALGSRDGLLVGEKAPHVRPHIQAARRPLAWLSEHPSDPRAVAVASLVGQATVCLALGLEGPGVLEPWRWSDDAPSLARTVELGTPPSGGVPT